MMETATTSETSVNFYQTTWRYNPEDRHLEELKCLLRLLHPSPCHLKITRKSNEEYWNIVITKESRACLKEKLVGIQEAIFIIHCL
jgi:hypothetical protein